MWQVALVNTMCQGKQNLVIDLQVIQMGMV
jgi:hypothetical protein